MSKEIKYQFVTPSKAFSSLTPSAQAKTPKSKEVAVFKPPPDANSIGVLKRKRKVKVLEEDEYVEKVEKIIERDFFPELDKHRARSDYIDAADRNDTNQMQRLRERFSTGRSRLESPATFDTPEIPKDNEDTRNQAVS